MELELIALSRQISHALRHDPWLYELEIDDEGWVSVDQLLTGLRNHCNDWRDLSQKKIIQVIGNSDKRRFELINGRIRALYGHSLPGKLKKTPGQPPHFLYHGTTRSALRFIKLDGLQPMGRQYVHLSFDRDTALRVVKRKRGEPIILVIAALAAWNDKVNFYQGNDKVWLADHVPKQYISF